MNRRYSKKTRQIKNGRWRVVNKHGVLIAEGAYVNNRKTGVWREYYDTGELMIEETYRNGVQHGKFSSYHPNGQLAGRGEYKQGRREGYFKVFDENGQNIKTMLFANNNVIEDIDETISANEIPATTRT